MCPANARSAAAWQRNTSNILITAYIVSQRLWQLLAVLGRTPIHLARCVTAGLPERQTIGAERSLL
jgi:hypothetical protein